MIGVCVECALIHLQMLVLSVTLPAAFSGIVIHSCYQVYVHTGTSSLTVRVLLFMVAAPFWIWITRMASTWNF